MKNVRIADLKARLSEHLRAVRRGETITVLDRDTPVARIVPLDANSDALVAQRPRRRYARLADVPLSPPMRLPFDIVDVLLEERGDR